MPLRFGRSLLIEVRRQQHEHRHLEELAFPVFSRRLPEVSRQEYRQKPVGLAAVLPFRFVAIVPAATACPPRLTANSKTRTIDKPLLRHMGTPGTIGVVERRHLTTVAVPKPVCPNLVNLTSRTVTTGFVAGGGIAKSQNGNRTNENARDLPVLLRFGDRQS